MEEREITYHDLERIAFSFVLETETWPVFLSWCRQYANSEAMIAWLNSQPNLRFHQLIHALHSPDDRIADAALSRLYDEFPENMNRKGGI